MGIQIDQLDSTLLPSILHEFAAMKDGITVKLTVQQVRDITAAFLRAGVITDYDDFNKVAVKILANIAEVQKDRYLLAGGTANALTLTPATPLTAYANGDVVSFKATATNSSTATLNVSAVGNKAIRKLDRAGADVGLAAGDLTTGFFYRATYSTAANAGGGGWIVLSPNTVTAKDDQFHLVDPADMTKRVRIDAGGVATGQTRVLSMPDSDVTISAFMASFLDDNDGATAWQTLGGTHGVTGGVIGWFKLPNGLIVQFGSVAGTTDGAGEITMAFPITFPNALIALFPTVGDASPGSYFVQAKPPGNPSGINVVWRLTSTGALAATIAQRTNWIAIGW